MPDEAPSWQAKIEVSEPLRLRFLENRANVMQTGNERAAVDFLAARGPMAKADDIGRTLPQACLEGQLLGVVGEGNKSRLAVDIVAHQNRQLAARLQDMAAMGNCLTVTIQECFQRGSSGQVSGIARVELLTPVWRVNPRKIKAIGLKLPCFPKEIVGLAKIKVLVNVA